MILIQFVLLSLVNLVFKADSVPMTKLGITDKMKMQQPMSTFIYNNSLRISITPIEKPMPLTTNAPIQLITTGRPIGVVGNDPSQAPSVNISSSTIPPPTTIKPISTTQPLKIVNNSVVTALFYNDIDCNNKVHEVIMPYTGDYRKSIYEIYIAGDGDQTKDELTASDSKYIKVTVNLLNNELPCHMKLTTDQSYDCPAERNWPMGMTILCCSTPVSGKCMRYKSNFVSTRPRDKFKSYNGEIMSFKIIGTCKPGVDTLSDANECRIDRKLKQNDCRQLFGVDCGNSAYYVEG